MAHTFTAVAAEEVSEEYRAELLRVQQTRTLSEEAGEFREYLVKQGVVEEVVKVLLGLLESDEEARPSDGKAFLKAFFDTKRLDPFVASSPFVDIDKLLTDNEILRAEHDRLSSDVKELTEIWSQLRKDLWAPTTERLLAAFPLEDGSEDVFDALALLNIARAKAHEAGVTPAEDAAVGVGEDGDGDAGLADPLRCSVQTLHDWALYEFGDADPKSRVGFEAFVGLVAPPEAQEGEAEADATPVAEAEAVIAWAGRLVQVACRAQRDVKSQAKATADE